MTEPITNSVEAGRALAESGAGVACIASSDAVYAELGESTAGALKAAGAAQVLLAGRPRGQEQALQAAGVDLFIFAGADAPAILSRLHTALGIQA
jgi:methylmalonyl-CoA mutase